VPREVVYFHDRPAVRQGLLAREKKKQRRKVAEANTTQRRKRSTACTGSSYKRYLERGKEEGHYTPADP